MLMYEMAVLFIASHKAVESQAEWFPALQVIFHRIEDC